MKIDCNLIQDLLTLDTLYRAGEVKLPMLASQSEILVEKMQNELPPEEFSSAMNCVYIIEEINAVVLDENRQPTKTELLSINNELKLLKKLLSTIVKPA